MTGTVNVQLVPQREEQPKSVAVTAPSPTAGIEAVIATLASNPQVDLEKFERLISLHERIAEIQSKTFFDREMSAAQAEMRPVAADATNPQTHSRYASFSALDRALRPIYTRHGFGLSFNTGDAPQPEYVRVLCEVTHQGGYSKSYHIDMPADGKGAKGGDVMTKTHAVGSAASYGMRYLLKMIFNVAVGEDDDDGNRAGKATSTAQPDEPDGYQDWCDEMLAVSDNGTAAFQTAWKASASQYRDFTLRYRRPMGDAWQKRAKQADAKAEGASRG